MAPEVASAARARYRRVQAAMARHDVGVLLLATPHLATFASGARRVQVAGSGAAMPWVVVTAGAPAATIFTTDPDGAPPWMPATHVEPLCWDRARQLARLAALVEPTRGAVACDVWSPAVRTLAGARPLIDAAPLLAEAAAPRTQDEIALVVRALGATRRSLAAACAAVAPGTPVAALVARSAAAMSAAGAGFPLATVRVWRATPTGLVRLGPSAVLAAPDLLALETALWVDGHAGVAGGTAAADGRDLGDARRAWTEAAGALARRCRAGATTADLRDAAIGTGAGQVGLLAHGLGVGIEPPYVRLAGDDALPLAAGTVLVLAPVVAGFRATRALLVTDEGGRWLEAAP